MQGTVVLLAFLIKIDPVLNEQLENLETDPLHIEVVIAAIIQGSMGSDSLCIFRF